jgi:hypothetical protein
MLPHVGNVTLPTPVFLAGGALCLLGGFLVGTVTGPGTPARTTGQVVSFDATTSRLCLRGQAITDQEGAGSDGRLCGTWRRTPSAAVPRKGDAFRFVTISTKGTSGGKDQSAVVIYGDVVG